MQSKGEIEQWYCERDPWGYESNPDDQKRKDIILDALPKRYKRALDIGAGEGWLTQDLPADEIHGIEISDKAADRFPDNVTRVFEPKGPYDLVIATGVLYPQYNIKQMLDWIKEAATDTILTCNIASWEQGLDELPYELVYDTVFPYRDYNEHLCIFSATTSA